MGENYLVLSLIPTRVQAIVKLAEDLTGVLRRILLIAAVSGAVVGATTTAPALAASSGAAFDWGSGAHGQLGDGTEADSDVPEPVTALSEVTELSGGQAFSIALLRTGTVAAWGRNEDGFLGNGSETDSDVPVRVSSLSEVTQVSAGWYHSLALLSNGTVEAWGYNGYGELGDGTETGPENCPAACSRTPVAVNELSGVTAVSANFHLSLALLSDGTVDAWGLNEYGELGIGTRTDSDVPAAVSGLSEVKAVAAGANYNLALLRNGTVMSWGNGYAGALGDGSETSTEAPAQVSGLSEVAAIAAGWHDSLALLKNGTVMAWGSNVAGQLGIGTSAGPETCLGEGGRQFGCSKIPVEVSELSGVSAISAGIEFSLALLTNGTVMAWGENTQGELGDRSTANSDVPVGVAGLHGATTVTAELEHGLAVAEPYVAPLPAITKVQPAYGPPTGGTPVTITGTNFNDATEVTFGSSYASSFKVESETEISAVSPPGTGRVDVGVGVAGVLSPTSAADQFSYAPIVTKVEPAQGPATGGTPVTITGTNFIEVASVKFGSTAATSFEVVSESTIKAVSPAGTDKVDVTVTNSGGTSPTSEADRFAYGSVPAITSVTQHHGPPEGGTTVTINGTGFAGATAVEFGSTEATSFKVESEIKITAVAPPFTGGRRGADFRHNPGRNQSLRMR